MTSMVSLIALKLQNKRKKKKIEKDKKNRREECRLLLLLALRFFSFHLSFSICNAGREEKNDLTVRNEGEKTWSTRVVIVINCYVIRVDIAISDMDT